MLCLPTLHVTYSLGYRDYWINIMHANVTSLLIEASYLMAVGMFVVFLFLSLLIGAMTLMAWLNKKFPESIIKPLVMPQQGAQSQSEMSTGLIAAITAAVHQHRNK